MFVSYVDETTKEARGRMSSERLIRNAKLTKREIRVAEQAARATADYRTWYLEGYGEKAEWDGPTALEVVEEAFPHMSPRRQARILDVACSLASERGADLTSAARLGAEREPCPSCGAGKAVDANLCRDCWLEAS